ncbi:hypothetical protein OAK51_03870 [Alphaproteobacteria bacterium]|nr:hypothetical protein [Alphaproteobacteria bacterium]
MFTRIHNMKIQNKVAKDSLKKTIKELGNAILGKGLLFYTFVDINDTNLYIINTWNSEKSSSKVHEAYSDFIKQIKEMGVNMLIFGGASETTFSKDNKLANFIKNE